MVSLSLHYNASYLPLPSNFLKVSLASYQFTYSRNSSNSLLPTVYPNTLSGSNSSVLLSKFLGMWTLPYLATRNSLSAHNLNLCFLRSLEDSPQVYSFESLQRQWETSELFLSVSSSQSGLKPCTSLSFRENHFLCFSPTILLPFLNQRTWAIDPASVTGTLSLSR